MRWILIGIGALMVLAGGIWLFQGIGILLGSVMTSQPFWAITGAIVLVIGVVLIVTGLRRGRAESGK
jgi:hypothetical protein